VIDGRLFAERTFHHLDFDAAELADRKRADDLTISVVVPALDEEATVGRVVEVLRSSLVDDVGLVDELLVIDGGSTDRTAALARAAGARVLAQDEVLPAAGTAAGKGEALWKGLAASRGDVLVFVDADVRDIGPRFVTGLVGPLLMDATIGFAKATYDRPLTDGAGTWPHGGGRVTELMARPLIAAFWPELAWLAQPLSGEYAARRQLLRGLPLVQGYGVELALLVDIAERHGVHTIAQVDLGERTHDHQPIDALGRMAAEILHVAVDRLSRQGRLVLTDPLAVELFQPRRDAAGVLQFDAHMVKRGERPALDDWPAIP